MQNCKRARLSRSCSQVDRQEQADSSTNAVVLMKLRMIAHRTETDLGSGTHMLLVLIVFSQRAECLVVLPG